MLQRSRRIKTVVFEGCVVLVDGQYEAEASLNFTFCGFIPGRTVGFFIFAIRYITSNSVWRPYRRYVLSRRYITYFYEFLEAILSLSVIIGRTLWRLG